MNENAKRLITTVVVFSIVTASVYWVLTSFVFVGNTKLRLLDAKYYASNVTIGDRTYDNHTLFILFEILDEDFYFGNAEATIKSGSLVYYYTDQWPITYNLTLSTSDHLLTTLDFPDINHPTYSKVFPDINQQRIDLIKQGKEVPELIVWIAHGTDEYIHSVYGLITPDIDLILTTPTIDLTIRIKWTGEYSGNYDRTLSWKNVEVEFAQ